MTAPSAGELLTIGRSFWKCRILLTAAELDLFSLLARDALTAAEVTQRLAGDERAVTILLDALAGMQLLEKHASRYRCPPELAAHLAADAPRSVLPMLQHMEGLWRGWSELTGVVRGVPDAVQRARAQRGEAYQRAFIGAMHVASRSGADRVVADIQPGDARMLLDVGGGPGTYTLAFLKVAPQLRATLFDHPAVVEMARERIAEEGLLERVTFVGGDFEQDELPAGHDLVLVSAIIHQNSPRQNVTLFGKCRRALDPGGRIVVRDHLMGPDRTDPCAAAVFAVNMLVRTEGGNCYTFDEVRAALAEAGFANIRQIHAGGEDMSGLVEAFK